MIQTRMVQLQVITADLRTIHQITVTNSYDSAMDDQFNWLILIFQVGYGMKERTTVPYNIITSATDHNPVIMELNGVSKAKLRNILKKKPAEKVIKYYLTPLQDKKKCAEFSKAVGNAVKNGDRNAEGLDAFPIYDLYP